MFIFDDPIYSSIDNPPDPNLLTVFSSLDSTFKSFIPIQTPSPTVHPPTVTNHVLYHPSSSSMEPQGPHGAFTLVEDPLLPLQPLSLDGDFGWFDPNSSSKASCASASASFSVSATLDQSDASGFDQLSLFDEVCASALSTPFTPNLDSPDLTTPNQIPLFECASEDVDASLTSLQEEFWNVAPVTSTPAQGSLMNLDFGLTSPLPPPSLASTTQSGQNGSVVDSSLVPRLQAETALLDFVLFDDITPPSPITSFSTPVVSSFSSPSVELKEDATNELALQLVAAAAASISQSSPMVEDQATDIIGSLFSNVDLSPSSIGLPSPATASLNSPLLPQDWTTLAQIPQTFSFNFDNSSNTATTTTATSPLGADMLSVQSSPTLPAASSSSPQLNLSLLLSLLNQQQQQQQQQQQLQQLLSPLIASMMPALTSVVMQQQTDKTAATTTATMANNPLKRKSDEIAQEADDDSSAPRQFVCSICGRAFSRLFNLNTHERTHDRSKARLFPCPEQGCKKSFTRKNDLQRHQISIHGVTHIYSCHKCDKPFTRRDVLRRHVGLKSCEDDNDLAPSSDAST